MATPVSKMATPVSKFPGVNKNLPDHFAARSRYVIDKYHKTPKNARLIARAPKLGEMTRKLKVPKATVDRPVCIIGAGTAGLYTAMILQSLGIPYELLETSNRVGGRLFTYRFPEPNSPYEYYDVGAMRFPDSPFMARVFDLVQNQLPPGVVNLIPYKFTADSTFLYYNRNRINAVVSPSPNQVGAADYVGPEFENTSAETIMTDVLQPFRQFFIDMPIPQAIQQLMNYDQYSTRSYMAIGHNPPLGVVGIQPPLPGPVINFCETMDKSTGWFDRALTETVLESLAFNWPGAPASWWCFDGGSQTLPEAMHQSLGNPPPAQLETNATALTDGGDHMVVTMEQNGQVITREYNAVFPTVPLSRLSVMDLRGCQLSYELWNAIRGLQYGPSIKIGMRFTEPWWDALPTGSIVGGQSYSDLPIRTTVYPSYPPGDGRKSRVLIASYCWTQDAERLGALINPDGTVTPECLKLVLRNLADVHDVDVGMITGQLEDYYAWDWTRNELTMGAFAFFGPQQFGDAYYGAVTQPACNGKVFIAGEATSSVHAWVAGALDSAWRAVEQYLITHNYDQDVKTQFHNQWGTSEYWEDHQMEEHLVLAIAHDVEAGL